MVQDSGFPSAVLAPNFLIRKNTYEIKIRLVHLFLGLAIQPLSSFGQKPEGDLKSVMGASEFSMQQLFQKERFPNVAVTRDGTVLATWGTSHVRVKRSEDGGKTFGESIVIAKPGFQTGGLIADEKHRRCDRFVEERHPPAKISIYRSQDSGKTWKSQPVPNQTRSAWQCTVDAYE